ncbi:MAG: GFA family protein, partial [Rhodospirillales bacterium]
AQGQPHHVSYCHCGQCRRHSGAPVAAFATYASDAVTFEQGALTWYRSSTIARRGFCAQCGTAMVWQGDDHRDWFDIGVGSFDDANDFTLQDHLWLDSALRWFQIDDHLPRYARERLKSKLPVSKLPTSKLPNS